VAACIASDFSTPEAEKWRHDACMMIKNRPDLDYVDELMGLYKENPFC